MALNFHKNRQKKGGGIKPSPDFSLFMVGMRGFEPPTPASRTQCSTGLSHIPNEIDGLAFNGLHL